MSISATCRCHKMNLLESLGACVSFPHWVRSPPNACLPWNFKEALSPAKAIREKECADFWEASRRKGYTQLVRARKDRDPVSFVFVSRMHSYIAKKCPSARRVGKGWPVKDDCGNYPKRLREDLLHDLSLSSFWGWQKFADRETARGNFRVCGSVLQSREGTFSIVLRYLSW
jgi:hypothetical protein